MHQHLTHAYLRFIVAIEKKVFSAQELILLFSLRPPSSIRID